MIMLLEYLPYTFLLLAVYIIIVNKRYSKQQRLFWAFVVVSLFSGLRYNVGHDYMEYYEAVLAGKGGGADRYEFFFRYLCYYLKGFPAIFMLVTSFGTNFFIFRGVRRFTDYSIVLPVLAFLCLPFFFLDYMCVIRFAFAVSLMFYAILKYNEDRKFFHFLIYWVIAINCHITAGITLLAIVPYGKLSPKLHAFFLVTSFFIGQVLLNYFVNLDALGQVNSYYSRYLINEYTEEGQKMLLVYGLFAALNIISLLRISDKDVKNRNILSLVNIGFCLLFMFSYNLTFAARISRYFIMLMVIAIQFYRIPFFSLRQSAFWLRTIVILLLFAELFIAQNSFYTTKSKSYMPYEMVIFK